MTARQFFISSIGRKITMAITGVLLIVFLVVHVSINACIWAPLFDRNDHGRLFNRTSDFMGTNFIIRTMEIGLFIFFIIHIIQGYILEVSNRSKRGYGYAVSYGNRGSRWYTRSMGLLGTLILLFLILHLANFWVHSRWHRIPEMKSPDDPRIPDMFGLMQNVFQYFPVVMVYIIGCLSLGYHVAHGFQSAFRSLGTFNRKHLRWLTIAGQLFSIVVTVAFCMMPLSFYFGWVS